MVLGIVDLFWHLFQVPPVPTNMDLVDSAAWAANMSSELRTRTAAAAAAAPPARKATAAPKPKPAAQPQAKATPCPSTTSSPALVAISLRRIPSMHF